MFMLLLRPLPPGNQVKKLFKLVQSQYEKLNYI